MDLSGYRMTLGYRALMIWAQSLWYFVRRVNTSRGCLMSWMSLGILDFSSPSTKTLNQKNPKSKMVALANSFCVKTINQQMITIGSRWAPWMKYSEKRKRDSDCVELCWNERAASKSPICVTTNNWSSSCWLGESIPCFQLAPLSFFFFLNSPVWERLRDSQELSTSSTTLESSIYI